MKSAKKVLFELELEGDEVKYFTEALTKIVSVETAITPHVMKILDDKETRLLEIILNELRK